MLSFYDLAYTAGIIDGEGYIGIIKRRINANRHLRYELRVSVTMCNSLIPSWLHANYGGTYREFQPPALNLKKLYSWRLGSWESLDFLKLISPYLKLKQGEAEIGIAFQECHHRYRFRDKAVLDAEAILHQKLKELHERQYSAWKGA